MAERQSDQTVDDGIKQPLKRSLLTNSLKVVALSPLVTACNLLATPPVDPLPDGVVFTEQTSIEIDDTRITFRSDPHPEFVIRYSPTGIRTLSEVIPNNVQLTLYFHQANLQDPFDIEPAIPSIRVPQPYKKGACDSRFSLSYGPDLFRSTLEVKRNQSQTEVIRRWNQVMKRRVYAHVIQSLHWANHDLCDKDTRPPISIPTWDEISAKPYPFWFDLKPGAKLSENQYLLFERERIARAMTRPPTAIPRKP